MWRRIRINWLKWLIAWGISLPGSFGHAEIRALLEHPEALAGHAEQDLGGMSLPPRHGPERLAAAVLTPVEHELWRCLQGEHDHD